MRRLTWFVGGVIAGAAGADAAKRKVRDTATKLSPANLAKSAGAKAKGAVRRGGESLRTKERELVVRVRGQATPLSEELDDVQTVIVDGKAVEPGKVVILRSPDRSRGMRRRGA